MPIGRLTREQVRTVDRRAIEEFGLPGIVLMENAARAVVEAVGAQLTESGFTAGDARTAPPDSREPAGRVFIVAGAGNNGGDGFAAARHLHNRGIEVCVCLCCPRCRVAGDSAINLNVLERMKVPVIRVAEGEVFDFARLRSGLNACDLIVDALVGTGLVGEVREPLLSVIAAINRAGKPIVAVDLPSGLDCDTGRPLGAAVKATVTVTLAAPKAGFAAPESTEYTGRVIVGDIGAPRELWETP